MKWRQVYDMPVNGGKKSKNSAVEIADIVNG